MRIIGTRLDVSGKNQRSTLAGESLGFGKIRKGSLLEESRRFRTRTVAVVCVTESRARD